MNDTIILPQMESMSNTHVSDDGNQFSVPATGEIVEALKTLGLENPVITAVRVDGEIAISLSALTTSSDLWLEVVKRFDLLDAAMSVPADDPRLALLT